MKKFRKTVVAVCMIVPAVLALAWTMPDVARFTSDVVMDVGSRLNIMGAWSINGTQVTSTAAELNIVDGVTVSAAQINAAGGGSTATLTPTLVSNATLKVYGSNLVIKAGGTVTLPAASVAAAALETTLTPSIVSNENMVVVGSNLTIRAGGAIDFPDDSLQVADIAAGSLPTDVTVTATSIGTAITGTIMPAYTYGYFECNVTNSTITNLCFVTTGGAITNVIDEDIWTP